VKQKGYRITGRISLNLFQRKKSAGKVRVALSLDERSFVAADLSYSSAAEIAIRSVVAEDFGSGEERDRLLTRWVAERRLAKSGCVSVLPLDTFQLVQVDLASLPQEERRDAARWQIRERLNYPPQEAVIDLFDVAAFAGEKAPLTYAVVAHDQLLRQQLQALKQAGLAATAIDLPEFALRNICDLFAEERGLAVLLLQEERGLFVVVRDSVLYLVRVLNTGMNRLAATAEGGLEALAEELDTIILEIQRSFDYCESTFLLPLVSRLLVAQTGRDIPTLTPYLNDNLSTRVEPFSFPDTVTLPEGVSQLELNRFLLAIGGALRQEQR
jgi:MSHA biogenesis protein MshI